MVRNGAFFLLSDSFLPLSVLSVVNKTLWMKQMEFIKDITKEKNREARTESRDGAVL